MDDSIGMNLRLALVLALASVCSAQSDALDEYCSRLEKFGFSGSVLVAREGKLLLAKGYGLADREKRVPNRAETLFDIASTTKQFTAAAILRLEMDGRLSTGDLLTKHFEGVPDDMREVTIHHLLTHTSGIPRFPRPREDGTRVPVGMGSKLAARPGTRFEYSNSNYMILTELVRKLSGLSYQEYVRTMLLEPAGIKGTMSCGDPPTPLVSHRYHDSGDAGLATASPVLGYLGTGGIVMSVLDLYKWDRALQGDRVLSRQASVKYQTPFLKGYAYGWWVRRTKRGTTLVEHGGTVTGSETAFRRFVDEDAVVIVIANMQGGATRMMAVHLEMALFGGKAPLAPKVVQAERSALAARAGTYRHEDGSTITVAAREGRLTLGATGQRAIDILYTGRVGQAGRFAQQERSAAKLLDAFVAGDGDTIRANMLDFIPKDWPERYLRDYWRPNVADLGKHMDSTILGSKVAGRDRAQVTSRLRFEQGSLVVHLTLQGTRLNIIRLGGSAYPVERSYQPLSTDEFGAHEILMWRTRKVRFADEDTLLVEGERFRRR